MPPRRAQPHAPCRASPPPWIAFGGQKAPQTSLVDALKTLLAAGPGRRLAAAEATAPARREDGQTGRQEEVSFSFFAPVRKYDTSPHLHLPATSRQLVRAYRPLQCKGLAEGQARLPTTDPVVRAVSARFGFRHARLCDFFSDGTRGALRRTGVSQLSVHSAPLGGAIGSSNVPGAAMCLGPQ